MEAAAEPVVPATPAKRTLQQASGTSASPFWTYTSKASEWAYLKLQLISSLPGTSAALPPLDALTARTHLTSALTQHLGLVGTSISVDLLKLDPAARLVWIRVPREDASAVVTALAAWIGNSASQTDAVAFRIRDKGCHLAMISAGSSAELFT
ncbi:hypothetical protein KEM52_002991 [Ascosphaera acerosa]|nr:hypothetical protein KEM52_002991 [Ascosphaera acerosa]